MISNDQRSPTTANASAIAQGLPVPAWAYVIALGLHIKPDSRYRISVLVWKSNPSVVTDTGETAEIARGEVFG
jgi:hypothetical protein